MPNKEDTKYKKISRMAMNAKQRRHLIQQNQQDGNECQAKKTLNTTNQQDGNECQTRKTLNTTKLVGWQ